MATRKLLEEDDYRLFVHSDIFYEMIQACEAEAVRLAEFFSGAVRDAIRDLDQDYCRDFAKVVMECDFAWDSSCLPAVVAATEDLGRDSAFAWLLTGIRYHLRDKMEPAQDIFQLTIALSWLWFVMKKMGFPVHFFVKFALANLDNIITTFSSHYEAPTWQRQGSPTSSSIPTEASTSSSTSTPPKVST